MSGKQNVPEENPKRALKSDFDWLCSKVQSAQLATLSPRKEAQISYTPYLKLGDSFYIFISELSPHTGNLKNHPKASIMLIEDEADSKNIFARRRLILDCKATFIARENPSWAGIMETFEEQRGPTMGVLKSLQDFWLVALSVKSGQLIKGFGQAYRFEKLNIAAATQQRGK